MNKFTTIIHSLLNENISNDGSTPETDALAKEQGLVKVYRSTTPNGKTLIPREGYQLTFSTRSHVAASYSVDGSVEAFYVKPDDFNTMESKDGSFSFSEFDRRASSEPTKLIKVYDYGSQPHVKETDPEMLYTYSSDIYGTPSSDVIVTPEDLLHPN